METLTDGLRKVMLAGIGALATTAEKSQELLDDLVDKGELTVEQGKALNQELKHNAQVKKAEREAAKEAGKKADEEEASAGSSEKSEAKKENFDQWLSGLSKEDLAKLKEALSKVDAE